MTTPNTPVVLTKANQQGLIAYHKACYNLYNLNWNIRNNMRDIDLAYIREADFTKEQARAATANSNGNKDRLQNVTIPIVYPQVESAVTYQSSVFLTGIPIFGVTASPTFIDQARAMETVIDDQATRGGWSRELSMFFRDGFKYNISCVECAWDRETSFAIETDLSYKGGREGKPKEVIWEGNKIKRWDLYNTIFDTRVNPAEMHQYGEFAGHTELMSRVRLKQFIQQLPDTRQENAKEAFESGSANVTYDNATDIWAYYVPQINPKALVDYSLLSGGFNWLQWAEISGANQGIAYKDIYEVTTMYCRIIPSDFNMNVPARNTPQIWKFVVVNHQVIIYAERQTNAHNYLPTLFGVPNEDGLSYQTKSLAENVSQIQDITSALSNANIAARRRAISDRVIYDPSRISEAHMNNPNPSAKIPVRAAAYGKNVGEAVFPFPFRDDQAQFVTQQMNTYGALANVISGQNPVRQGQFVKGNKTQHEFADVMANANGRDQVVAINYESQIFTPLKIILKTNILQYQGGVSLYNREQKQNIEVDPVALRKAIMQFKVSDGLSPKDKLINSDTLQVAMQVFGSSPVIAQDYNVGQVFSYMMKTQGAEIDAFEKSPQQKTYEQAGQQWQQTVIQLVKQNPEITQAQLPAQPKPQDYGYDPSQQTGAPTGQTQQTPQQSTTEAVQQTQPQ